MTTAHVIEANHVSRHFGSIKAVEDVSFTVGEGEIFGLIGHNGAGKSTLFKMMLGLIAPTRGDIRLCGESISGPRFRDVRRRVGYLPENLALYDNLTGEETLAFFARLKGTHDKVQRRTLLETVGLTQAARRHVREYSKGMRQRLGFAQALLGEPRLLLLDEPTNGLDPQGIHEFYDVLSRVRATGATVILTSHILAEIEQRVDRLALMSGGKLAALGSVDELSAAIALPLEVELKIEARMQADMLAHLSAAGFTASIRDDDMTVLQIARGDKMRLLATVAAMSGVVRDVRFIEPTLEAVFLGHQQQATNEERSTT